MQVRVHCDDCGIVQLHYAELKLRRCLDTDMWASCFRCPHCGLATTQLNNEQSAIDLLVALGTPVEDWRLPMELLEAKSPGPNFILDDLLDFHLLLARDDWLDSLSSTLI